MNFYDNIVWGSLLPWLFDLIIWSE